MVPAANTGLASNTVLPASMQFTPPVTAAGPSGMKMLGYGLAGTTALSLLGGRQGKGAGQPPSPGMIRPYEYSSNPTEPTGVYPSPYATTVYDTAGNPVLNTRERNYFDQQYTALEPYKAAKGGIMQAFQAGGPVERMSMMNTAMNPQGGLYPQGMIDKTQYATPIQRPVSSELVMDEPAYERSNPMLMAEGGITYDAATQKYSGLPSFAPAASVEQLPADLVASLTPQYQAANPNFYSYDAKNQRYGVGIPSMSQLNAFKEYQDQKAAEDAAAQAAAYQQYDSGGGGAAGGLMPYNLGGYSDGGRLLRGPGDGVSDDIPAVIGNRQPARLADGEFVIPARIVSELGNGSTDAGAKRLYAMMDRIQSGRKKTIGKGNVAKDTKAKKHLLA
jgi:hypothetical protein